MFLNPNSIKVTNQNERNFRSRIFSNLQLLNQNNTESTFQKVLQTIPIGDIYKDANERMKKHQKEKEDNNNNQKSTSYKDELMKATLNWYKTKFFKWKNNCLCTTPECVSAKLEKQTKLIGMGQPNLEERAGWASRIEVYKCFNCNKIYRFPRYNRCSKLLETKEGRCGEWANCFTTICNALGFEVRYIADWTDHVWIEYYSEHHKRWIHCDCCENLSDKPFVYSEGWKKKLTFVIAINKESVVDVTKRYIRGANEWKECLNRRKATVSETWLKEALKEINYQLSIFIVNERKQILHSRSIVENQEFEYNISNSQKELKKEEEQGRISGSKEWKKKRGEFSDFNSFDVKYIILKSANLKGIKKKLKTFISGEEILKNSFVINQVEKEEEIFTINKIGIFEFINFDESSTKNHNLEEFRNLIINLLTKTPVSKLFPILDLLRLFILNPPTNKILFKDSIIIDRIINIFTNDKEKKYANHLLILRFLTNLFHCDYSRQFLSNNNSFNRILKVLETTTMPKDEENKYFAKKEYSKAFFYLIFNFTKFTITEKKNLENLGNLLTRIVSIDQILENASTSDLKNLVKSFGMICYSNQHYFEKEKCLSNLEKEIPKRQDKELNNMLVEFKRK